MDDLEYVRQHAAEVEGSLREVQDAAPERTLATDRSTAVRVALDRQGLPESIQVREDWRDRISPRALGAAVVEAAQQAADRRADTWVSMFKKSGPGQPTSSPYLDSTEPPAGGHSSRPLTEIAGELLGLLDTMLSTRPGSSSRTVSGSEPGKMATVTLARNGQLSCSIDDRWAAQQSGGSLTRALGAALASARDQLQDQDTRNASAINHAARLTAEIQAASNAIPDTHSRR